MYLWYLTKNHNRFIPKYFDDEKKITKNINNIKTANSNRQIGANIYNNL